MRTRGLSLPLASVVLFFPGDTAARAPDHKERGPESSSSLVLAALHTTVQHHRQSTTTMEWLIFGSKTHTFH